MNGTMPRLWMSSWRHSLRGKLIAIVVAGAIVPLALLTVWTTHRLRVAGEELLRSQLSTSLSGLARAIEANWRTRLADIALLSDNDVVRRALLSANPRFTDTDQRFLDDAFRIVQPFADEVVFSDAAGTARWRIAPDPALQPKLEQLTAHHQRPLSRFGTVAVDVPIMSEPATRPVGTMTVLVRMTALVRAPAVLGTSGASIDVLDVRGASIARWDAGGAPDNALSARRDGDMTTVTQTLSQPPLRLVARAPLEPFVAPFERNARLAVLLYIAILAATFATAAWLVMRATRALHRLVEGAEAVAQGNFDHEVDVRSGDEIARVAAAFNTMTRELQRMLREASQRNALAAVGEFAAELAHEVRNPLTSVRLDLQRLQERLPQDAKMRDPLSRALSAIERLNRTVTGALRIARSGTIRPAPVQLGVALEPAFQTVGPTFAACNVTLNRDIGDASAEWLRGDADALTQLFTNILINAAESIERQGSVDVSAAQRNGSITVMITDSGSGIPPDVLRQLREPFHTTTKEGGTGLGLTIARRIASAHGGRIEFASEVGRGTTVTVTLPRHQHASGAVQDRI